MTTEYADQEQSSRVSFGQYTGMLKITLLYTIHLFLSNQMSLPILST